MEFAQSIKAFFDCYNSIDVRVAAFWHDNKWKAAYPLIRFRAESVEEIKKIHENLVKTEDRIENEKFKIFLDVLEPGDWNTIKSNWLENKIVVEDTSIEVKTNSEMQYSRNSPDSHDYYDFVNAEWDSYHVSNASNIENLQAKLRELDPLANAKGYNDIFEYISTILQIPHRDAQSNGMNKFTAPVFFKIDDVSFDGENFSIVCIGNEDGISAVLKIQETFPNRSAKQQKSRSNLSSNNIIERKNSKFTFLVAIKNVQSNDRYEIIVTRNNVIVAHKSELVEQCWLNQTKYTNPILDVFQTFLPYEQLEDMLLEPKNGKDDTGKKLSYEVVFERAVAWLLSLLGFTSIRLQEFQNNKEEGTKRVSVDIIASFDNNKIILAHPTVSTDLGSQLDSAANARSQISSFLSKDAELISVVFTPKPIEAQSIPKSVVLIDHEKLKLILADLRKGQIDRARGILIPGDSPFL